MTGTDMTVMVMTDMVMTGTDMIGIEIKDVKDTIMIEMTITGVIEMIDMIRTETETKDMIKEIINIATDLN